MKGNRYRTIFLCMIIFVSCNTKKEKVQYESPKEGTIHISVDESFKPVITEEIKVYESTYPEAHIIAEYKSEAACFRDLGKDSTRMIIVAKGLTDTQAAYYTTKFSYRLNWDIVAYDAVSVIVNIASPDSVFTMQKIKQLLTDSANKHQVVVDGNNATSTVRFLLDSVLKGASFGDNVQAAQGSKAVLDYVSNNINAVGFVGSSWVGNDQDPGQVAYQNKIRLALLECKICEKNTFAKPSQATITYGQYPLVRPLYYILNENFTGLGTGFANFMSMERGQLIFKRDYLVPAKMDFGIRTTTIKP